MTSITTGSKIRKMCNSCNTPKPQAGGAMATIFGSRKWICLECNSKRMEKKLDVAQRKDS